LRKGKVVVSGQLTSLLKDEVKRTDVALGGVNQAFLSFCESNGLSLRTLPTRSIVEVEGEKRVAEVLRAALDGGVQVLEVVPRHETLEDLFVREAIESQDQANAGN
jgi:ABC-2 type transport system ATP-binding protein